MGKTFYTIGCLLFVVLLTSFWVNGLRSSAQIAKSTKTRAVKSISNVGVNMTEKDVERVIGKWSIKRYKSGILRDKYECYYPDAELVIEFDERGKVISLEPFPQRR